MQARFRFASGMARLSLRQSEAGSYTALLDANGKVRRVPMSLVFLSC